MNNSNTILKSQISNNTVTTEAPARVVGEIRSNTVVRLSQGQASILGKNDSESIEEELN